MLKHKKIHQQKPKKPLQLKKKPQKAQPNHDFEEEARSQGYRLIAGIDEAGRGPLAGPVVAAACIIPKGYFLEGVNDSKKLTPLQRTFLFREISSNPDIIYGVGVVSSQVIDRINILQATIQAMHAAVDQLGYDPDMLLVDGMELFYKNIPSKKIIKGDARSFSIATASIIAKCTRDEMMVEYHKKWPQYGFNKHKGYGTKKHIEALEEHGPCAIHRYTFAPLSTLPSC